MATALHSTRTRFFDKCGKPLCGGTVHTYQVGTTTAKPTYTDASKTAVNTNPVILDSIGSAAIFLDGAYRVRVLDRNGVLVEDIAYIESWISATEKDKIYEIINEVDAVVTEHVANTTNPHQVNKAQIGLGNVDDTADIDKPVSNAAKAYIGQQDALKADSATTYTKVEVDTKVSAVSGGYIGAFATLAELQAKTGMTTGQVAKVMNDPITTNNGDYRYTGSAWVKGYDALTDAKNYTDTATNKAVNNLVQQDAQVADLFDLVDSEGNIVAKITDDGMLYIVGLDKSVQLTIAENTNNITDLNDSVADINNKINTYPTNDLYSWLDSEGNIVAKIGLDGKFYIVGLDKDIVTTLNNFATKSTTGDGVIKDTSLAATRTLKDTFTQPVQTVLNSLMYAQTGAKAPPPLHYFKQNYTIDSTWINNINQFGHSNSTRLSIATPYHTDDGVVHPHILEFYNGFRGYRYIICITPYYLSNEAYENPCIYGSNDLINLTLLDGFTQPLDNRPQPQYSTGHNSDNTLAYNPKTGELICIWRQSLRDSDGAGTRTDALWMRKTKDGYTWTDKQRIFLSTKNTQAGAAGSPAIVYDVSSEYWYMYVTTLSSTNDAMRLFRAKKLDEDAWEYVATLTLPFKPWHQDIKIVGGKVCMLVYCYPPDNTIYFGIADNFTNFTWTQNLLLENNAYKASFVPEFNTNNEISLKILYTTDASPSEASEKWRMYMHQTNFINANLGVTP